MSLTEIIGEKYANEVIPSKGIASIIGTYNNTTPNGSAAGSTDLSFEIAGYGMPILLEKPYDLTDEQSGSLPNMVTIKDVKLHIANYTEPGEDDNWTNEYIIYSIHFTPLLEN